MALCDVSPTVSAQDPLDCVFADFELARNLSPGDAAIAHGAYLPYGFLSESSIGVALPGSPRDRAPRLTGPHPSIDSVEGIVAVVPDVDVIGPHAELVVAAMQGEFPAGDRAELYLVDNSVGRVVTPTSSTLPDRPVPTPSAPFPFPAASNWALEIFVDALLDWDLPSWFTHAVSLPPAQRQGNDIG